MSSRKSILLLGLAAVVAAGAFAAWGPGAPALRKMTGLVATEPPQQSGPQGEKRNPVIRMDQERIALAKIEQVKVGPATIMTRLSVPAVVAPDADRVAHVSVKLSGTVAELRKNIGDEVEKGEVLGALESREVADAKSEYMAARLSNDLQQDLAARDKAAWGSSKAIPEQQYIRSRNAASQTAMRLDIARQKLLALGVDESEIVAIPQAPEGTLRLQNVRALISGRVMERKVDLGTAVGRDNLETELFVIVDLSRVWVEMAVNSSDLPAVREGQSVAVSIRGGPVGTGKIIFVSPLLDKDTRAARVVATLDNPDRLWRPGSFVTAAIAVDSRLVSVAVPAVAVQSVNGRKVVFVRTAEGFEKRDVVLGFRDNGMVEVTSGLAAGETIASSNTFPLKAELSKPGVED
ncbi:efflux RND transporter periplasmic adaptor subunit (plasmid) [Nitrobacter sp. NHB1]|uniref:efflux RND transporter periplasmic adaptor subunit n=1 Tax=Nitrobacter sp. NHB1 TaxID=3119830 RepID=UPI002FFFA1E7